MSITRLKRLDRAQMFFCLTTQSNGRESLFFFAPGVMRLPVIFDDSIPTACTDGKEIRWNGQWFDKLPDACLPTVLAHEVCHCLLGHLWRMPLGGDWRRFNIACDHAVNLMLKDFSAKVIAAGKPDPFPFPDPQDAYCADPQYAGLAEEAIYNRLPPDVGSKGSVLVVAIGSEAGSGPGGCPDTTQGNKVAPAVSQTPNPKPQKPDKHSMPDFGQMTKPAISAPADAKKLRSDWEATLIQAVQLCKGRGNLPGALERFVDGLVKPQVPWWELLRSFLREQCADDWSFSTPALEMSDSRFMLPSLKSEKMGSVVFGSDWSGSTFGDLVEKFHVEKESCLNECRPSKLIDIGFDTRIVFEREYVPGDVIERKILGGGGTSFVEFFKRCADMEPPPKCAVVLTDLDGEMPKEHPDFPVLWVCYGKGKAPFGEVIYAE